ncbi:MAG: ABC transporter substrate-binding protein [Bacteroidetes bacterium SB0662_bin_6]|nr:ABC transporter substrate-binding protein [Bacteroidetes bacterium SB0668_bin_1]MYE03615.1 ABC transporter substrate-binding protein [Bacteroidetes bacterium SB0662_bin_6]
MRRFAMQGLMRTLLFMAVWYACLAAAPGLAFAQDAPPVADVPEIEDAERMFEDALEAFEQGEYALAGRLFGVVRSAYDLHRKTTAALLMEAKALYREGRFEEVMEHADLLESEFPSSGYVDAARRLREMAEEGLERDIPLPRDLGILLPLDGNDAPLSQALFTGVRIAVDEHNAQHPDRPVRMIFRNTGVDSVRATGAVEEIALLGVQAIIGPLYSSEAVASAGAAERAGVVLVAPLATDERVSGGKRYVFQANPTIVMRGRLMARFAARSLRLDDFGVIAERDRDGISERMAQGFLEEAVLEGRTVRYDTLLASQTAWSRLSETLPRDTILSASAVYMPIVSGESVARIDAAMGSFESMGLGERIRVLGNGDWRLAPNTMRASRYATTYADDFYVDGDDPALQAFAARYRELSDAEPEGRLAITGYDVARFLLPLLVDDSEEALADRVRAAPLREGLGTRIDFEGGNVNAAMFWFRYQDGMVRRLR